MLLKKKTEFKNSSLFTIHTSPNFYNNLGLHKTISNKTKLTNHTFTISSHHIYTVLYPKFKCSPSIQLIYTSCCWAKIYNHTLLDNHMYRNRHKFTHMPTTSGMYLQGEASRNTLCRFHLYYFSFHFISFHVQGFC
jgi:hypothetical protein